MLRALLFLAVFALTVFQLNTDFGMSESSAEPIVMAAGGELH
jgi:hypothetical protein